jgi:hypothetical protein
MVYAATPDGPAVRRTRLRRRAGATSRSGRDLLSRRTSHGELAQLADCRCPIPVELGRCGAADRTASFVGEGVSDARDSAIEGRRVQAFACRARLSDTHEPGCHRGRRTAIRERSPDQRHVDACARIGRTRGRRLLRRAALPTRHSGLSARELEVLELVAEGLSAPEIVPRLAPKERVGRFGERRRRNGRPRTVPRAARLEALPTPEIRPRRSGRRSRVVRWTAPRGTGSQAC